MMPSLPPWRLRPHQAVALLTARLLQGLFALFEGSTVHLQQEFLHRRHLQQSWEPQAS